MSKSLRDLDETIPRFNGRQGSCVLRTGTSKVYTKSRPVLSVVKHRYEQNALEQAVLLNHFFFSMLYESSTLIQTGCLEGSLPVKGPTRISACLRETDLQQHATVVYDRSVRPSIDF